MDLAILVCTEVLEQSNGQCFHPQISVASVAKKMLEGMYSYTCAPLTPVEVHTVMLD